MLNAVNNDTNLQSGPAMPSDRLGGGRGHRTEYACAAVGCGPCPPRRCGAATKGGKRL